MEILRILSLIEGNKWSLLFPTHVSLEGTFISFFVLSGKKEKEITFLLCSFCSFKKHVIMNMA